MLSLAIDTAVGVSVALVSDSGTLTELALPEHGLQGEKTTQLINQLLETSGHVPADVTDVIVGVGPGPFTGLRVGIATAQAFAFALNVPAIGICSLDAIGFSIGYPCVVVTDARRKELYWAEYNGDRVAGPAVATPQALAEAKPNSTFVGPGVTLYPEVVQGQTAILKAAHLVSVARTRPAMHLPLTPLYLRNPDAVEPTTRKSVL